MVMMMMMMTKFLSLLFFVRALRARFLARNSFLSVTLQLGDWVFLASGTGIMPGPAESINIYSELGGNSSVILPFRNPTDHEVVVDVILKERTMSRSGEKDRAVIADKLKTRLSLL